jgi:translation elongation factor EF-Tu-like GTPase
MQRTLQLLVSLNTLTVAQQEELFNAVMATVSEQLEQYELECEDYSIYIMDEEGFAVH